MKLSNFRFKLPEEQIAQFPSRFRDEARLMVLHAQSGEIEHKMMNDLASYFDEGDVVIANDTKVFPARLYAQNTKLFLPFFARL
jgi:S-adenosylmethionine:tRNA ribosyltransferase-isomerase